MLERLSIRHFRGFKALKMERLARVNLIAGKNGAGKTALLEALFLLAGAGNIDAFPQWQALRGMVLILPSHDRPGMLETLLC